MVKANHEGRSEGRSNRFQKSSFPSAFFGGGFSVDDERTEREVCVRLRGRHLKERSAASPKTSFGVRLSGIHEARKEGVPWPRPSRASFHQAKASNKCTTGLAWVDYEQPLFFLGHSSKTRETRKWPRASRFSRRHSHSRALPWLKCLQSQREGGEDRFIARWLVQSYKLRQVVVAQFLFWRAWF